MSDHLDAMRTFVNAMNQGSPHAIALKMETVSLDADGATLRVPYDEKLIGDPDTGVIAGGVVTALLDHACGQAVHTGLTEFKTIATLDLRIDYMRPATPGQTIRTRAECHHVTRSVAFVRAVATDDDDSRPVAMATGAFTVERKG